MKKNGFILIETLIATTLIASVFTILFIEFNNIKENYKYTFENNTVEKMYATSNIKNYILSNGYENIIPLTNFIDITSCQNFTNNKSQCENLMNVLEVKQALLLPDDMNSMKGNLLNSNLLSSNLKRFVKLFNDTSSNGYRLIVEYKDGRCATLRM